MKLGKNNPCPCGSGKKYKHCCIGKAVIRPAAPTITELNQLISWLNAGRLPEVERHTQTLVQQYPNSGIVWKILGTVLHRLGKEALPALKKSVKLLPNDAEAYFNLGVTQGELGQLDSAAKSYQRAVAIKPDFIEAHNNLGQTLFDLGQFGASVEACHHALKIKPDYAGALHNLGQALRALGQLDDAINCYRKALDFRPNFVDPHSGILFLNSFHAAQDPMEYLAFAKTWEKTCLSAQDRQAARQKQFQRSPLNGRRLKIGYMSGDYRQHAVSYFVEQLFTQHDQARVELFAYSTQNTQDAITHRLRALVEHWVPLSGFSDSEVQHRVEADKIDVLVDLSGHTEHNRLGVFARRAAPVQVHYLGFMASTGLTEMDYWIGDDILTPPETDHHFSEKVWRLPRVWVSYEGKVGAPTPNWMPNQNGSICLGSFNNLGKLTPETLKLWAEALHALPEGKLLLKTKELADSANRQRVLDTMARHGISPERIELQDRNVTANWHEHMAYYDHLDIALDPVGGTSGGTTTCDALWMGVPVITLEGDRMASRMSASMLHAIGHPEWIAHSKADYISRVVSLARDVNQRKILRPLQRSQMANSPLCNANNLAHHLEETYFKMFEHWQQK